jgi:hypothetical protein
MSEALYYPYTRIQSSESLKAMVLYFDKIHIISPNEASIGSFQDDAGFSELSSNGLIEYVSPSELLRQYDRVMTKSVIDDLTDHGFLRLSHNARGGTWQIFSEKVPSSLADHLLRKYFVDVPNFYAGEKASHFVREGPHEEISESSLRELIEARHEQYTKRDSSAANRDKEYHEYRHVTLPFEVGESLMINHAICASSHFALTPITDSEMHNDFLIYKLSKASNSPILKRILKDYRYIKNIKTDLTAVTILSETVPSLTGASVHDILEFRDENKDSMQAFRILMGQLSSEIQANFWDPDFQKQMIDMIDDKVKPAIEDLKVSTESAKKSLARMFKKGAAISPLPITASLLPGCAPEIALAASAGIFALDAYLDYTKRSRLKKRNGFAYLFNVQRALSKGVSS